MIETKEQAPEPETVGREPAFSFGVAAFVLSELLCIGLFALVFL